ncbi:membrane protein [Rhizocola hellebori]|uniref:Membrane protein n=1 Tax=Rhizocola hellebori TaxID=1392758 RepID=A0A8J3VJN8_9ACTN|nr:ABC transporter permease [Rhizocola hellebori]GIH09609.1 membrane protein [Rhizocola hellebori]
MIKASLRGLLQRKLRLALAVIAIVLSVGFLSGSMVLSDTLNARFAGLFATINENVAVQVQPTKESDNGERVLLSAAELEKMSKVDGVDKASGEVSGQGVVPFQSDTGDEVTTQTTIAAGTDGRDPLGLVELREGDWPHSADEVAISANTAKLAKVKRGEQLKIFVPQLGEPKNYRVSGIVGYSGGRDSLAGEALILFELGHAQEMFYGKRDVFANASFSAKDGVTHEELKKRIEAQLPAGFKALTGEEVTEQQSNVLGDQFSVFQIILTAFAIIAAFVGIFLIYNTFNIIVAQRSRELALLRAMGAGWGQVVGSVMLEALIVGGVGATLGLALGAGVGALVERMLTSGIGLGIESAGIVLSPWAVLWSYAMGILVTVIAAFVPAIKASSVPPVAAMREVVRPDKSLVGLTITGSCFLVPGLALVALPLLASVPQSTLILAAGLGLVFIGVMLLSPMLAKPVVRLLGYLVGWGQAGKLGVRNSLRNPRRTAVTAISLMIGVTLISAAATVTESFKTSLENDIGRYDVAIIVLGPNTAPPDGRTGYNPTAMDKVSQLPGVTDVASWHITLNGALGGQPYPGLAATDVAVAQRMWKMETIEGRLGKLSPNEFVIDDNLAKDRGWKVGEKVKVRIEAVERDYTLVGIYKATPTVSGPLLAEAAVDDFAGGLAYQGFVSVSQGTDVAATVASVDKIMSDYPGVTVGDMSAFLKQFNQIFDFLLRAITFLLGVALIIALLGILNTLLLSIVERTRELGLVRAIGLSRGAVVRMVGVESILIAVFGCLLGLVVGVGSGAALSQALIEADFMTTIVLPWTNLIAYVVTAILFGVFAAVVPALRAAFLNVLDAIAYE